MATCGVRPDHCRKAQASLGRAQPATVAGAQEHFARLVPEADVDARCAMYTGDSEGELLGGGPDYVIDAIDNIDTKVALLVACRARSIPVLCVAGAGTSGELPYHITMWLPAPEDCAVKGLPISSHGQSRGGQQQ